MTSSRILSLAAVAALMIPTIAATPSYAQNTKVIGAGPGGGARTMGTFHGGGSFGGGGWHGGGPRFGGGGGWHRGGGWRGGGFGPGFAAGAVIGGALASGAYYGNPYGYYAGSPYYGYVEDDAPDVVEVAPGDVDVNYCIRTYKSYNVRTGTYLGYDGRRYACP